MPIKGKGDNWNLALDYIANHAPVETSALYDYMAGVMTEKAVSIMLSRMVDEGAIRRLRKGVYDIATNGIRPPRVAVASQDIDARSVSGTQELSLADRQRKAFAVEIYASVIIEPRITSIHVRYEGMSGFSKLPLWGAVRICLGPDDPGWQDEWSNRGVVALRMIRPDGTTREFSPLDPSNSLSIAPLRD